MFPGNNGFIRSRFLDGEGDPSGGAQTQTITIEHGGQKIEVPRPAGLFTQAEVEEKYVLKAAHNDQMGRMRTQLDGFKGKKSADEYLVDSDFKTKAMAHWGLLDPKATNEEYKAQLQRATTEIREREINPLQAKVGTYEKTIDGLRAKDRAGQIMQGAAAAGIEEKYLKAPTKGGKPLIVSMLEDAFAFDAESGEWYAKGTGASPFAFSQSGDTPYMTVSEFLGVWAKSDGKDFVKGPTRQAGAESSPAGQQGGAGRVGTELRVTHSQMRDMNEFRRLSAKAEKEGLTIVPVEG